MSKDQALREQLVYLLSGGGAHCDFDAAVEDLPGAYRGQRLQGVPHTPYRLVEHMRLAQWDILEFCRNPSHVSPDYPDGYWPSGDAPLSEEKWNQSIQSWRDDMQAMQDLVADPKVDLYQAIPHGDGQTILREALLVADHNAYHIGQLIVVRRALGVWE